MTVAILVMLGLGATCGIILSVASKVFYVYEDPRIGEVEYFLAGANCGGCGYAGCSAAAVAVIAPVIPRREPWERSSEPCDITKATPVEAMTSTTA